MIASTTMESAFAKAGKRSPRQRLVEIAERVGGLHRDDFAAAKRVFWAEVSGDAELLCVLCENYVDRACAEFLRANKPANVKPQRGHAAHHTHNVSAPSAAQRGGQLMTDAQGLRAAHAARSDDGQSASDALKVLAVAGRAGGMVDRAAIDTQKANVHSASHPRPRSASALVASSQVVAASLSKTFMVTLRQGSRVPVGNIRVRNLDGMIGATIRRSWVADHENEVLRHINAWVKKQAYIPTDATVAEVLGDEVLSTIISGAAAFASKAALMKDQVTTIDQPHYKEEAVNA